MKNLLYITNIAGKRMSYNFCGSAIEAAHSLDLNFYSVANRSKATVEDVKEDEEKYGVKLLHIDLARSPFSRQNLRAYKQLCKIIRENEIDCIHCNTPVGGILGRLAGKKCKVKHVMYQVHGFHFYKGASKLNWMLYYPIEKWLAHHTDALITINQEDFDLAKNKFHLRKKKNVYFLPGVGIDLSQYQHDKGKTEELRASIGVGVDDVMLISAGDLVERKNYKLAIRAIAEANMPNLKYCICGTGPQRDELAAYAKELGVESQILLLGFRSDMKALFNAADIFLFTTKQEGLPRSMMEAMASGLPCIASEIRGNTDLLKGTEGGFLCEANNVSAYAEKIKLLATDPELRKSMGNANLITIQRFSLETVTEEMRKIYTAEFV